MAHSNENSPLSVAVHLGSLTTDGSLLPALQLLKKSRILGVKLLNGASIAADNTNYFSLALKKGSTVIASMDSRAANQGAVTANVSKDLPIVSGQEEQVAGSDLSVLYNEAGTMALQDAKLVIHYFPL